MSYVLYKHQTEAKDKSSPFDSYAYFMEPGTGKTLLAIEFLKEQQGRNKAEGKFSLVVCPLSIIESVWIEQCSKFAPELTVVNLWKYKNKKKKIPPADVYVINYESVKKMKTEAHSKVGAIVLDESSKIKNPKSAVSRYLMNMSKVIKKKLILTGTPAPNNLLEYWSQMFFVNPDILGDNFWVFRYRNFFSYGYGKYQFAPKTEFKKNIGKILAKQSFSIKKKDCLDLPEQVYEVRKYQMKPQQQKAYDLMLKKNILTYKDCTILGSNELAKIMKLRQITAGFVIDQDGKNTHMSDGKLNLLKETLELVGENQAIIWCQFKWEIEMISKHLGAKACELHGGVSQTQREVNIKDFQSGKKQYLIAHPKSGGHGLNFSQCSYSIYFSLSYSFEEEKQSQDRCHRIGQQNKVTYYYLVADKSIDEKIFRALRNKEKISDAVLKMIREEA